MAIDVAAARAQTPGADRVVHLNNAGASLLPAPVLETIHRHLDEEALTGSYEAEARAQPRIDAVYGSIARLLHCAPSELALTGSATRAWDMAFYGLRFSPGDRILTARVEYASNYLALLQVARRTGARVEVIPDDEHGQVSLAALERLLDEKVKLISLTHVPTNGGLVNPAEEVGRLARRAGIPYLLDACQSVGQLPVDVEALGCDMLSATGRKFLRGPRGTGFLYVRAGFLEQLEPPFVDVFSASWTGADGFQWLPDARRFEEWECDVAGRLGLGAAVDHALGWGVEAIAERVSALAEDLRARLARLPGVTVRDKGLRRSGIVTFTREGRAPREVKAYLQQHGINVHTSELPSTPLDMTERQLPSVVRASVHYFNTGEELERTCALLRDWR